MCEYCLAESRIYFCQAILATKIAGALRFTGQIGAAEHFARRAIYMLAYGIFYVGQSRDSKA